MGEIHPGFAPLNPGYALRGTHYGARITRHALRGTHYAAPAPGRPFW